MTFRILHISDLHIRGRRLSDVAIVLEAFLSRVQIINDQRPIDVICFTGDLAYSGSVEEYDLAESRLVRPLLSTLGLPRDRFLLVPGNHDVSRGSIDPDLEAGYRANLCGREQLNDFLDDSGRSSAAMSRLAHYEDYWSGRFASPELKQHPGRAWSTRITGASGDIGFVGLNSAWRCTGDSDRGRLLVGERQAEASLRAVADSPLRIVLVHHPFHWLTEFDQADLGRLVMRDADMVLSGHLHMPDPLLCTAPSGTCLFAASGALFEGRRLNGFSVVDLDTSNRSGVVSLWRYYDDRRRFDIDIHSANDGEFSFQLGLGSESIVPVNPTWFPVAAREISESQTPPAAVSDIIRVLVHQSSEVLGAAWVLGLAFGLTRLIPDEERGEVGLLNGEYVAITNPEIARQLVAAREYGRQVRSGDRWLDDLTRELVLLSNEAVAYWHPLVGDVPLQRLDSICRALFPIEREETVERRLAVQVEQLVREARYDEALAIVSEMDSESADRRSLEAEVRYALGHFAETIAVLGTDETTLAQREYEWLIWSKVELGRVREAKLSLSRYSSRFLTSSAKIFARSVTERVNQAMTRATT
jgi:predicted MPP superfamily phosphohydrolase